MEFLKINDDNECKKYLLKHLYDSNENFTYLCVLNKISLAKWLLEIDNNSDWVF